MSISKLNLDRQAMGQIFSFGTINTGGQSLITFHKGTSSVNTIVVDCKASANIDGDLIVDGRIINSSIFTPYYIALNETFFVPLYKQVLYKLNIIVDGFIQVDGFLAEVS